MPESRRFLKSRAALLGVALALGGVSHCAAPSPPEKSLLGLSAALGRATGGVVDDRDIAWEESPGFWTETFLGRHLLFLSREKQEAPRDLYRARVRVTRGGQIIEVRDVRNLTDTPQGDDAARGARRAGQLRHAGLRQDPRNQRARARPSIRSTDRPESLLDRALLALTSLQQTGTLHGIGRPTSCSTCPPTTRGFTRARELTVDFGDSSLGSAST